MEMTPLLIFITTTVVFYSVSSDTIDILLGKPCENDNNCYQSELCHNSKCVNACAMKDCSKERICQVRKHKASCLCPSGFVKNKTTHKCDEKSGRLCSNHYTCYSWEICLNRICIDACAISVCGEHQGCFSKYHESFCYCLSGYAMNSTSNECEKNECLVDGDCPGRQKCMKSAEGLRSCKCMTNHVRIDGTCMLECASREDCGNSETCTRGNCTCDPFYKWDDKIKKCFGVL